VIYKDFLFKEKLPLFNRGLDAYSMRQTAIAKNLANATTPDYQPTAVKFEEKFNEANVAIKGSESDQMHIPIGQQPDGKISGEEDAANIPKAEMYFSGENHVNIDKEMSNLAQNQIKFRFASRMVKRYFAGMQSAITGFRE
jgi:flagellar basal-body rod protein FlgB